MRRRNRRLEAYAASLQASQKRDLSGGLATVVLLIVMALLTGCTPSVTAEQMERAAGYCQTVGNCQIAPYGR